MNGVLFFLGTFFRWLGKKPLQSALTVAYYATLHGVATLIDFNPSGGLGFLFTLAVMTPLFFVIGQGLPLDCLNPTGQIKRETSYSENQLKAFN
ncbi:hypothetical protein [Prochlorococcus sp. MIT 1341]|uniref:hypothetical protein n=1 Tax=Prochlorococcus sp. MIT 1341 TaxID=3096221 RepID=UPI002A763795|nr:hypothetical protein [Prochlorococcus sp. MIT 1341]